MPLPPRRCWCGVGGGGGRHSVIRGRDFVLVGRMARRKGSRTQCWARRCIWSAALPDDAADSGAAASARGSARHGTPPPPSPLPNQLIRCPPAAGSSRGEGGPVCLLACLRAPACLRVCVRRPRLAPWRAFAALCPAAAPGAASGTNVCPGRPAAVRQGGGQSVGRLRGGPLPHTHFSGNCPLIVGVAVGSAAPDTARAAPHSAGGRARLNAAPPFPPTPEVADCAHAHARAQCTLARARELWRARGGCGRCGAVSHASTRAWHILGPDPGRAGSIGPARSRYGPGWAGSRRGIMRACARLEPDSALPPPPHRPDLARLGPAGRDTSSARLGPAGRDTGPRPARPATPAASGA